MQKQLRLRRGRQPAEESGGGVTWAYGYDALNRLVSARRGGTLIARYAYDVEGRRIAKRVYSSASGGVVGYTRFVYRGAHVGFETDSAGTTGMKYVWGLNIDDLIAFEDGSGNHYYVAKDKVGSIRNVATRSGTWVMRLRHRPYGTLIDSVGTGVMLRYRWTGREWDAELGWYFMRARHYDPVVSRFVQEDPIGFAGGDNLYAYAGGSPLEARDPMGLKAGNVDGPFEGFCFGGGSCVNWDGTVTHGGSGWGTGGGGGGISSSYLDQGRAAFELAYELSVGVKFEGTPEEIDRLRNEWAHAMRTLREGARRGTPDAKFVSGHIKRMVGAREWTFIAGDVEGAYGENLPPSSFIIDILAIDQGIGRGELVSVASVMVHEFGHAYYRDFHLRGDYHWYDSNSWAGTFENAYRDAIGWQHRQTDHGPYPQRPK